MTEPARTGGRSVAPLTVAVAVAVVVVDQLTKWWAVRTLDDRDIDVFWTLRFHLSHNTGMAFSRGQNLGSADRRRRARDRRRVVAVGQAHRRAG